MNNLNLFISSAIPGGPYSIATEYKNFSLNDIESLLDFIAQECGFRDAKEVLSSEDDDTDAISCIGKEGESLDTRKIVSQLSEIVHRTGSETKNFVR